MVKRLLGDPVQSAQVACAQAGDGFLQNPYNAHRAELRFVVRSPLLSCAEHSLRGSPVDTPFPVARVQAVPEAHKLGKEIPWDSRLL